MAVTKRSAASDASVDLLLDAVDEPLDELGLECGADLLPRREGRLELVPELALLYDGTALRFQ